MFLDFFFFLRAKKFPVSVGEYLMLLAALEKGLAKFDVEEFFFLSKAIFVKNEIFIDVYERLFGEYFKGIDQIPENIWKAVAEDWLKTEHDRTFSEEEKAAIEAEGGLDALLGRLKNLLETQKERHEGGNQWIGTNGTSPYGNSGFNPEGVRIGGQGKNQKATKVWEQRDYKNYDGDVELNTRNIKLAMRRLRILTREGAENELDLDGTIQDTSRNGGMLDIRLRAERKNRVKVLLLLDVGGSMDEHIERCEQIFSAAKYQFRNIEHLYFHNCIYENLWKDNSRRHERIATWEILHKYNPDWKVIIVGDASMASYEVTHPKGSIEHYNEEAGITWLERLSSHFRDIVWLNPITVADYWQYTPSIKIIRDWSENRMFPLTLNGLTMAMKCLKNSKIRFEV